MTERNPHPVLCDYPGCDEPAVHVAQGQGRNTAPKQWFACEAHRATDRTVSDEADGPTQEAVVAAAEAAWQRQGKSLDAHDERVIAVARLFSNHLLERRGAMTVDDRTLCTCGHPRSAHRLGRLWRCLSCPCPMFVPDDQARA